MANKDDNFQLESVGLAIIAVAVSTGFTVGFGLNAPVWLRALAGLATLVGLLAALRLGTSPGRGMLTRLARWVVRS